MSTIFRHILDSYLRFNESGLAGNNGIYSKIIHDGFSLTNDQFRLDGPRIRIPNLGWVRMRKSLRFAGKIMSATVSRVAERWFVSINVDALDISHLPPPKTRRGRCGFGCVRAGDTFNGRAAYCRPKAHTAMLKRLRRLSQRLSRKQDR